MPIIIIKKEYFLKAVNFLRSYYKYKEFQNITILIDKLIKPTTEKYIINHAPNKSIATLFMETTDSNNYEDYLKNKNEIKKIINLIKEQADKDKLVFQNNNFKKDIEKWVRTVFIIMAEYIQFLLRIKPIYYICNNCFYPVIFFDNKEYKSYIDKIKNKLNKNINEIKIVNSFIYMIIPSFFKNHNLPEVNVLYYDEHYSKSDCNVLKSSISGCFILSKNLYQLDLILKEIKRKCSNNNNIKFQLIISGISCQEVFHYILEEEKQQKYIDFIDNLCIYSKIEIDSYEDIKQLCLKNNKKIEIYKHIELIVNTFLKTICTPSQCYTYTKVINYDEYEEYFYKFHEKISLHYGNVSEYIDNLSIFQDFLTNYEENKLLIKRSDNKISRKNTLINAMKVFEKVEEQKIENYKDVIKVYTNEVDSFYKDFNRWLIELDKLAYDKISFFIADFMFCLNEYGEYTNEGVKEDIIFYRGIKLNYIDLLLYEYNKNNIITFPSFTSCSTEKEIAEGFSDRNISKKNRNNLFSVIFEIKIKTNQKYFPLGYYIYEISKYRNEKEALFQPFTFFKIKTVNINLDTYEADIKLRAINKFDILELYIKDKFKLEYNEIKNIVEIPDKSKDNSGGNYLIDSEPDNSDEENIIECCNNLIKINKGYNNLIKLNKLNKGHNDLIVKKNLNKDIPNIICYNNLRIIF